MKLLALSLTSMSLVAFILATCTRAELADVTQEVGGVMALPTWPSSSSAPTMPALTRA